jgi:uncharacterized RDD family membrane protein YckC
LSQTPGIVTPEAVLLEFETAGVGSRLLAAGLDLLVRVLLLVPLVVASAVVGNYVGFLGVAGLFISLFVFTIGYPVGFEALWKGRTPGKAALGLRVVTLEGAPVRFRHAAIRGAFGLLEAQPGVFVIAVISIFFSGRNQRLGDLVAGTVVLRERTGAAQPAAVTFPIPYGYESYAATLDISGVTAADYAAIRSLLLRAPSLDPMRRYGLARQLAIPILDRLHHSPPPGIGPEPLLACVAALYQQRQRGAAPAPMPAWGAPGWSPPGAPQPPGSVPPGAQGPTSWVPPSPYPGTAPVDSSSADTEQPRQDRWSSDDEFAPPP